jgi:hypothetical protein
MITDIIIPFYYNKEYHKHRVEIALWVVRNGGRVEREVGSYGFLGRIKYIIFEDEASAIMCKLKFGL